MTQINESAHVHFTKHFICSLEDLRQKINSGVGKVDVEESKISIGSFCVAKFSEDDRQVSLFNYDYKRLLSHPLIF